MLELGAISLPVPAPERGLVMIVRGGGDGELGRTRRGGGEADRSRG